MSEKFYALIIAGGRGERLRPLTDNLPKPMIPLNGRPILWYQVEWMRSYGVTDVIFLCGYLGDTVSEYFGDGSKFGINAHYSYEDSPLGRGDTVAPHRHVAGACRCQDSPCDQRRQRNRPGHF